ncbi:MAG TPA: hypothetical protein VHM89_01220 [Acidimicrobiales bacterium]|nr:hypothetical protein [Acidimicrobiales bacterium]
MGKASSNKKVARAASTGGGRTARGARPWGWYGAMAIVVLLGSLVIVTSRNERQAASNPLKSEKPRPPSLPGQKQFAGDHWHAAYGIYVCGQFLPPIQSDQDPRGIHTHGDGVVHIHPFTKAASGRNATFGVFAETVGLKVSASHVQVPGGENYKNGGTCPDKKKASLKVYLNGDKVDGDPKKIRLRDRDLLVIAFVPSGTDVPKDPPSAGQLDKLNDVPGSPGLTVPSTAPTSTPSSAPGDTTPGTTAPSTSDSSPATTAATTPSTTGATSPSSSP